MQSFVLPVQGASNPTSTWKLQSNIASGGWTDIFSVTSAGAGTFASTVSATGATLSGASVVMSGLGSATGTPDTLCLNTNTVVRNAALTCTVSSRDYKTAISDIRGDPAKMLMGLRPVQFAYNDHMDRMRLGFIAEEAASVDPKLADGYDDHGTARSLDQNAILAVLVAEVQRLRKEIDVLKGVQ